MQTLFGTSNADDAKRYSKGRRDSNMTTRNGIIHRGTTFVAPTSVQVKEAVSFFTALMNALANVLDAYIVSL